MEDSFQCLEFKKKGNVDKHSFPLWLYSVWPKLTQLPLAFPTIALENYGTNVRDIEGEKNAWKWGKCE